MSEEPIWDNFRAGDMRAFEAIYNRYANELYQYARNFSSDSYLIEESIQELFTRIWEKRTTIGPTTSIRFYLLRSIRRLLFRRMEQNRKHTHYETDEPGFVAERIDSPETHYIITEEDTRLQHILLEAINSLPVNQREVMYLRYYQELSFDEIAAITGISKKTAYNIVFIALNRLRKKLKNIIWILCCVWKFLISI